MIICDRCPRKHMTPAPYRVRKELHADGDDGGLVWVELKEDLHLCGDCVAEVGRLILAVLQSKRESEETT